MGMMFRSTKKRKIQSSKKSFRSSLSEKDDQDDANGESSNMGSGAVNAANGTNAKDEGEDATVVVRRKPKDKKRLKRSGMVIRSFNEDDKECDDGNNIQTKDKKSLNAI